LSVVIGKLDKRRNEKVNLNFLESSSYAQMHVAGSTYADAELISSDGKEAT